MAFDINSGMIDQEYLGESNSQEFNKQVSVVPIAETLDLETIKNNLYFSIESKNFEKVKEYLKLISKWGKNLLNEEYFDLLMNLGEEGNYLEGEIYLLINRYLFLFDESVDQKRQENLFNKVELIMGSFTSLPFENNNIT